MTFHIHKWVKVSEINDLNKGYLHKKDECKCGAQRHTLQRRGHREVEKIIPAPFKKKRNDDTTPDNA